jgi:hypothetical protein
MVESYKRMFNENPPLKANSQLEDSNDHPEVDTSEFLDEDGIQKYQVPDRLYAMGHQYWMLQHCHSCHINV